MGQALSGFYDLTALDAVTSTNDVALARAAAGAPEGTLITARTQSAGRGRRGRTWFSPVGNLHLSLVLTPGTGGAPGIGFAASLAAADAVQVFAAGHNVQVKWPNDVLLDGAKVAGLLIEVVPERPGTLVLGVGIDVTAAPGGMPYPATSLAAVGVQTDAAAVRDAFCAAFERRYRALTADGFAPVRAVWLARAAGVGKAITVNLDGARYDGVFSGLDEGGALVLDQGGGRVRRITAGDVFNAPA